MRVWNNNRREMWKKTGRKKNNFSFLMAIENCKEEKMKNGSLYMLFFPWFSHTTCIEVFRSSTINLKREIRCVVKVLHLWLYRLVASCGILALEINYQVTVFMSFVQVHFLHARFQGQTLDRMHFNVSIWFSQLQYRNSIKWKIFVIAASFLSLHFS